MKEIQTLFNVKKTYQNHEISTKKFKIISNFKNAIYNQYLANIVCIIKKNNLQFEIEICIYALIK